MLRYPDVWCGVLRCGVVCCGVVWCGVVWCGVVWWCVGAAILSAYGTLRFFTSMSILFFPKFKNVFNSLTILVYLSVMAIGQYYGMQLLGKMKTMKDQAMKRQLTKLTMFIVRTHCGQCCLAAVLPMTSCLPPPPHEPPCVVSLVTCRCWRTLC